MKLDKATMRKIQWLIVFTVLVIFCFFRFDLVMALLRGLARLLTPFALGAAMAFGINLLLSFLEPRLFGNRFAARHKFLQKIRRPVSILLSVLIILGVLAAVIGLVIPQILEALRNVVVNLDAAVPRLREWLNQILADSPELLEPVNEFLNRDVDWAALVREIVGFLKSGSAADWQGAVAAATGFLSGIFSSVSTFMIAFVFSCYILGRKEKLYSQASRTVHAFLPDRAAWGVSKVLHLCQVKFGGFITGTESQLPTVLSAVQEAGRVGEVKIVAIDITPVSLEYVLDGTVAAVITQNPFNMGYTGTMTAYKAALGEEVPEFIDSGSAIVDLDSMKNDEETRSILEQLTLLDMVDEA